MFRSLWQTPVGVVANVHLWAFMCAWRCAGAGSGVVPTDLAKWRTVTARSKRLKFGRSKM